MKEQKSYFSNGEIKTIGFTVSHKENEKCRVVMPDHIGKINHQECLCFEEGYGSVLGISDKEYTEYGYPEKIDIKCDNIKQAQTYMMRMDDVNKHIIM